MTAPKRRCVCRPESPPGMCEPELFAAFGLEELPNRPAPQAVAEARWQPVDVATLPPLPERVDVPVLRRVG